VIDTIKIFYVILHWASGYQTYHLALADVDPGFAAAFAACLAVEARRVHRLAVGEAGVDLAAGLAFVGAVAFAVEGFDLAAVLDVAPVVGGGYLLAGPELEDLVALVHVAGWMRRRLVAVLFAVAG